MHRVFALLAAAAMVVAVEPAEAARESSSRKAPTSPSVASDAVQQRVVDLIKQLGDDEYAVRRRAEEDLIRLGPDAFDQLKLAEDSMDLEVAERARYIVHRMRVEWVRPEDSPEVRRALARYGDLSEADRNKRIARLAELEDDGGLPALCRIARLEPSPRVARRAALEILQRNYEHSGQRNVAEACQQELGQSERAPVEWIRIWLREGDDRKATLPAWHEAVETEASLLAEDSSETDFDIVYELMKRRLELCNELNLVDETTGSLMRMVQLWGAEGNQKQMTANLGWAIRWIIDHKRWDVLEQVEQQQREQLYGDRQLLYYLAAAKSRAGQSAEAEELADQAFQMAADDAAKRVEVAGALAAELGFVDWAEREYRKALVDLPVVSAESLQARRDWAMWLHDREQYKEAAGVLGEFFDALAEEPKGKLLIRQMEGRQFLNAIRSRREFYLACDFESRKEYVQQREALEKAAALYGDDPDILIAMYRSPGADDAFRKQTIAKINDMSQRHLALIEQYPDEPSFHNQWAWLASNTEGDSARAVEHSLRSLELSPNEPSYLDTLARCYYAAGDLEKAIEAQRRAVELAPHYGVMRRQLEQFERELAAKGDK